MNDSKQVDVWIVEDNFDYREQLAEELSLDERIHCSHALGSFEEARELLVSASPPDVALLDLNLPGTHGLDAIAELKQTHPLILTMVLTISGQRKTVFNALRAGASGYLLKSEPPETIIKDICELSEGGAPLSSSLVPYVLDSIKTSPQSPDSSLKLGERELEILKLLADGCSRSEIGVKLSVATVTVDYHLRGLYAKLGVRSTTAAVAKAFRYGVLR
ncbi:MAG: response regulator [Opitutaceae bacterium]